MAETYKYFLNECPFANEYQVFWGENTTSTKRELYELRDEEQEALGLYETNPKLAEKYLTEYSTQAALDAEAAARELFATLLAKYADGRPRTTVSEEWRDLLNPTPVP